MAGITALQRHKTTEQALPHSKEEKGKAGVFERRKQGAVKRARRHFWELRDFWLRKSSRDAGVVRRRIFIRSEYCFLRRWQDANRSPVKPCMKSSKPICTRIHRRPQFLIRA